MRAIERALENIRSVIEQQETEWLEDNGYEPIPHKPEPKKAPEQHKPLSGKFSAGRFLGTSSAKPETPEPEEPQVPEEPAPEVAEPEIVHVLPQKDNHHSWLYNEVVKAIHDAAGDAKNTKIIAVFIPVVQNGREFEDLPVSESVELSPVSEEDVRVEELVDLHEEQPQPEEPEPEEPELLDIEQVYEPPEVAVEPEPEEPELDQPEQAEYVDEIVPEPEEVPDPELAEAFSTMEEKLDEHIAEQAAMSEEEETPPEELEVFAASEPDEVLEPLDLTEDAPEIENIDEILTPIEPEPEEEAELVIESVDGQEEQQEGQEDMEGAEEEEEESKGERLAFTEIPDLPELDDDDEISTEHNDKA